MFKKITILITIMLAAFTFIGCESATTTSNIVALPDLEGMSQAEITSSLEALDLTAKFYFINQEAYLNEDDYDKFIQYGSDLVAGDMVERGSEIRVYTSPLNLDPLYYFDLGESYPDLQLTESDYLGSSFINDGIGEVTVSKFVDGDTTFFSSDGQSYSVRYLGIDTPESTALYEPWGKAAANYTKEKLENAEKIVLQSEGDRQDGNGRYLAWVWYVPDGETDLVLLNLELVELAYSKSKYSTDSAFAEVFLSADINASLTKRRVWGEVDPDYDYSKEGTQMSIQYLMENFIDYVGLKVVVSGEVTRKIGNSVYIQDETGYGVYMYAGYTSSAQLQVGANVTIGALVPTYYSASPQLSSFYKTNLTVNTEDYQILPLEITYDDFCFERIGTLISMTNLEVTGISQAQSSSSESVYVMDSLGNTFTIRIDDSTGLNAETLGITVGSTVDVTGLLSYYDFDYDNDPESYTWAGQNFQVMLITSEDININ